MSGLVGWVQGSLGRD